MSDDWRTAPTRPRPCPHCGLVESALAITRHVCNPTHVIGHRYGADAATAIGRAVVRFLTRRE